MTIGENIKFVRQSKKLTQKDLADILGVTPQNISQYECGLKAPKYETIVKLAHALSVNPSDLDERLIIKLGPDAIDARLAADPLFNGHLEDKLRHIGYSLGANEEDAAIYIQYPDGLLEVTEEQLFQLDESADEFLKFQLSELRRKNSEHFHSNK